MRSHVDGASFRKRQADYGRLKFIFDVVRFMMCEICNYMRG